MSGWQEPRFDNHAFAFKRTKAVSPKSQISFQDMEHMHIMRRKVQQVRRLPTPEWSVTDAATRETVLRFCEARLYIKNVAGLSDSQRIAQIKAAEQRMLPMLEKTVEGLQNRYASESCAGTDPAALEKLATEIQNFDTQVLLTRRGNLAVVTSVAYRYYRLGEDSVTIAEALGIKSPMVRVWLHRLNAIVKYPRNHTNGRPIRWTRDEVLKLFVLRNQGKSLGECGAVLNCRPEGLTRVWRNHFGKLSVKPPKAPALPKPIRVPKPPKVKRDPHAPRAWTPDRLQYLFVLRATGKTFEQCGKIFGISFPAVQYAWTRYFGKLKVSSGHRTVAQLTAKSGRKRELWTDDMITRLAVLRAGGATFAAIATELGLKRCQCAQGAYTKYVIGRRA